MKGPAYTYSARCIEVHDGDTYTLEVDVGFDVVARVKVRLHGWSCPELATPDGDKARDMAKRLLAPTPYAAENPPLTVKTYRGKTFGRWLGDVYVGDSPHLGELLEHAGLARKGAFEG